MVSDDVLVVTDGWSGLCFTGTDAVYLGCYFVDEGQHDGEGQSSMLTEDIGAHGIAVVDEVAAEDGCEMEVESVGGRELIYLIVDGVC